MAHFYSIEMNVSINIQDTAWVYYKYKFVFIVICKQHKDEKKISFLWILLMMKFYQQYLNDSFFASQFLPATMVCYLPPFQLECQIVASYETPFSPLQSISSISALDLHLQKMGMCLSTTDSESEHTQVNSL